VVLYVIHSWCSCNQQRLKSESVADNNEQNLCNSSLDSSLRNDVLITCLCWRRTTTKVNFYFIDWMTQNHQWSIFPRDGCLSMEQSSNQCHYSNFSGFLQETTKNISFYKIAPRILVCVPCHRSTFAHATLICTFLNNDALTHRLTAVVSERLTN